MSIIFVCNTTNSILFVSHLSLPMLNFREFNRLYQVLVEILLKFRIPAVALCWRFMFKFKPLTCLYCEHILLHFDHSFPSCSFQVSLSIVYCVALNSEPCDREASFL
uniref:Uncharacterized protein n=1 Tax=Octopus bimaculoides TaxID=37653 RepID=A0A0L8HQN2_OCTBM